MSKGTFFGNLLKSSYTFSLDPFKDEKQRDKKNNLARDAAAQSTAAKVEARTAATEVEQRQKAKQVAAINTPSKGFGSNSLENLSRSFLLRL